MAYKVTLNYFTGELQLVNAPPTSNGVVGIPPTVVGAIASWADTTGNTIQNTLTNVQSSGAIEAQMFITRQDVTAAVTIDQDECAVCPALNLTLTGSIDLSGGGSLEIV